VTILGAQKLIILSSLGAICLLLLFYILSPVLGYPLEYDQAIRLIQINVPVFLGYIGSATQFLFTGDTARATLIDPRLAPLLKLLVPGPLVVFAIVNVAVLFAFGWTNRAAAPAGVGMTVDTLSIFLTTALGILTVSTGVIVSYLFSTAERGGSASSTDAKISQ
jgi:hypothetical protein